MCETLCMESIKYLHTILVSQLNRYGLETQYQLYSVWTAGMCHEVHVH